MNTSLELLNKVFELSLSEKDCDIILKVAEFLELDSDNLHDSLIDGCSDSNMIDIVNAMLYNSNLETAIEFNVTSQKYEPIINKDIIDICEKLNCAISK